MSRTIFCTYLQRDAEGQDFQLYPGELGALGSDVQREHVAAERGAADGGGPTDGFETPGHHE